MSEQNQHEGMEEIVFLFATDGGAISSEMRYAEFEAAVNRTATLEEHAASSPRA
jgi:hypothetical protein